MGAAAPPARSQRRHCESLCHWNGLRRPGGGNVLCGGRERRHLRRHRRAQDRGPEAGRGPHLRAGPRGADPPQPDRTTPLVHERPRRRGTCIRHLLHRGRNARGRRRLRRPARRARRRRRDRRGHERLSRHRLQEHRPGRHGRQGARRGERQDHPRLRRRLQSRVSQGRCRGRRLHEARPRRDRRRQRARHRHHEVALRTVRSHREPDPRDGQPQRRNDQVRGQRLPRDARSRS